MDKSLKEKLQEISKDMYRILTMMDTAILVENPGTYLAQLGLLKQKLEQCEAQILKLT